MRLTFTLPHNMLIQTIDFKCSVGSKFSCSFRSLNILECGIRFVAEIFRESRILSSWIGISPQRIKCRIPIYVRLWKSIKFRAYWAFKVNRLDYMLWGSVNVSLIFQSYTPLHLSQQDRLRTIDFKCSVGSKFYALSESQYIGTRHTIRCGDISDLSQLSPQHIIWSGHLIPQ